MQNVSVQNSTAERIHGMTANVNQTITWEEPPRHHNIKNYTITYEMGNATNATNFNGTEVSTINNATQATLVLSVPQGKGATYGVRVAAVSQYGQGEFSDRVELAYSSKFIVGLV